MLVGTGASKPAEDGSASTVCDAELSVSEVLLGTEDSTEEKVGKFVCDRLIEAESPTKEKVDRDLGDGFNEDEGPT